MSHEHERREPHPDSLTPIEQALAGFTPSAPRLDRDRLMFLAGQASAEGRESEIGSRKADVHPPSNAGAWLWPASTAVLTATSLALLIALVARPAPQPQIVYLDRLSITETGDATKQPASPAARDSVAETALPGPAPRLAAARLPAIPEDNYLRSRDVALRLGLDALGSGPGADGHSSPAPTYRELLETLSGSGSPANDDQPQPRVQM